MVEGNEEISTANKKEELMADKDNKVPVSKKSKKTKIGLIIGIVAACLIGFVVIIVLIVNSATTGPQKVSDQLITDIKAKNGSGAYSLLSPSAKTTVSEQQLQEIVDRVGPILTGSPKLENKEVSASTDNGSTAKFTYTIKGTDGTYTFIVNMVKENDVWKVLNFDSTIKK